MEEKIKERVKKEQAREREAVVKEVSIELGKYHCGRHKRLFKLLSTLKSKGEDTPSRKQAANYVKRNFGDVIKKLGKE